MTKISVVMPAYNAAKTISNAVNSILNQTLQAKLILLYTFRERTPVAVAPTKFSTKQLALASVARW